MSATEQFEGWNDNHPWLTYTCAVVNEYDDLKLRGKTIQVRWVFQTENFKADEQDALYFRGLAYDRQGQFYAITEVDPASPGNGRRSVVKVLSGKQALTWFAQQAAWDATFARELCRAIDNPHFEFMPLVPVRDVPKRQRKAKKRAEAFHEQLHLATALVECVRKLDAQPSVENLSEACRQASRVHAAIHAPENFKLVANG